MNTTGLPRSADRPPETALMRRLRPAASRFVRRRWQVKTWAEQNVPTSGPAILAANHIGLLDGTLLAILSPRPVHALTKREMFEGRGARFLHRAGQIPVDRERADLAAVRSSLSVLRSSGVLGIFPEGTRGAGEYELHKHGAAYFALVTGAPVIPVTFFGTRPLGGGSNAVPERGARLDIVYGEPWTVDPVDWPRRREHVDGVATLLHQHLRGEVDRARVLTGRDLPGPLRETESDQTPRAGS